MTKVSVEVDGGGRAYILHINMQPEEVWETLFLVVFGKGWGAISSYNRHFPMGIISLDAQKCVQLVDVDLKCPNERLF